MHCPWNKGYTTLTVQNATKVNFYCHVRGEKPFNLQNKISESEIELDILPLFSPLISYHLSYTHEKRDSGVDQRNISISAVLSLSVHFLSLSCLFTSFTFSAFVVYKLLKSL